MNEKIPFWPAAMDQKTAAAYCGIGIELFKLRCPVKPIRFTDSARGERYPRHRLDEWLQAIDPNGSEETAPRRRRFGEKLHGQGQASRP